MKDVSGDPKLDLFIMPKLWGIFFNFYFLKKKLKESPPQQN